MPLIIFLALVVLFYIGLSLNPREVPSPLIDKPAPSFELPLLLQEGSVTEQDFKGKVTLVNVWASWCFACRQEHEVVKYLASQGIRVIGLNYKDKGEDAKQWLQRLGNPYQMIAVDIEGRSAIDWGVYGAPETFLVDEQGIIRHKVIGPLTSMDKLEALLDVSRQRGYDQLTVALEKVRRMLGAS